MNLMSSMKTCRGPCRQRFLLVCIDATATSPSSIWCSPKSFYWFSDGETAGYAAPWCHNGCFFTNDFEVLRCRYYSLAWYGSICRQLRSPRLKNRSIFRLLMIFCFTAFHGQIPVNMTMLTFPDRFRAPSSALSSLPASPARGLLNGWPILDISNSWVHEGSALLHLWKTLLINHSARYSRSSQRFRTALLPQQSQAGIRTKHCQLVYDSSRESVPCHLLCISHSTKHVCFRLK